jgi:hypothetical protein
MVLDSTHMHHISDLVHEVDNSISRCTEEHTFENVKEAIQLIKHVSFKNTTLVHLLDEDVLYKADRRKLARISEGFKKTYSIDSGTINPITYTNGTVLDVCHGAMACTPSNKEIERHRTIGTIVYISDNNLNIVPDSKWKTYDNGYGRSITLTIHEAMLKRRIPETIHSIIIKFIESEHFLWLKEKIESNSMVILDGSIYPKQILYWIVDSNKDMMIRYDSTTIQILQNYIDIADYAFNNNIPLIGFVKNPTDSQIMRSTTMEKTKMWLDDTQLFKYILNSCKDENIQKSGITYTGWFWQPNRIYGTNIEKASPLVGNDSVSITYPKEFYDPVFFMVYIPRTHSLFKIESLYGFIKDKQMREKITQKVLCDIAVKGSIPETLNHADYLAKISRKETNFLRSIVNKTNQIYDYNAHRWSDSEMGEF